MTALCQGQNDLVKFIKIFLQGHFVCSNFSARTCNFVILSKRKYLNSLRKRHQAISNQFSVVLINANGSTILFVVLSCSFV